MSDLQTNLRTHQQAVDAFVVAARAIPARQWSEPRAPGKWSPGQITEHLALTYEANRGVLQGAAPTGAVPGFLRPLIRKFFLQPVLRRGRFSRGSKSPKAFRPSPSPLSPDVVLNRLQAAAQAFEKYVTGARTPTIEHPFFGRLPLTDFVRLQEIHTQHHRGQLPGASV